MVAAAPRGLLPLLLLGSEARGSGAVWCSGSCPAAHATAHVANHAAAYAANRAAAHASAPSHLRRSLRLRRAPPLRAMAASSARADEDDESFFDYESAGAMFDTMPKQSVMIAGRTSNLQTLKRLPLSVALELGAEGGGRVAGRTLGDHRRPRAPQRDEAVLPGRRWQVEPGHSGAALLRPPGLALLPHSLRPAALEKVRWRTVGLEDHPPLPVSD